MKLKSIMVAFMAVCLACAGGRLEEQALWELDIGNYVRAKQEIERALEEDPDNEKLLELQVQIDTLWQIDQARRLIFNNREVEALVILDSLLEEDPENGVARSWATKAHNKLAEKRVDEGLDLLARGRLVPAREKFTEALEHDPSNSRAPRAIEQIDRAIQDRLATSHQHYGKALGARTDLDWLRVGYHTGVSVDSNPKHTDAKKLHRVSDRELALTMRQRAESLEAQKYWGAAARKYRTAAKLARESGLTWVEEVLEQARVMDREHEAGQLFQEAELRIAAGRFDEARKLLEKAGALTKLDRVLLNKIQAELNHEETETMFREAMELKADERYEQALEKFRTITETNPYGAAVAHVEQILEILSRAAELYEQAESLEKQGKHAEALALWKELNSVHPRYRDVAQRLEKAKARVNKKGVTNGQGGA